MIGPSQDVIAYFDRRKAIIIFGRGWLILALIYASLAYVALKLTHPEGVLLRYAPLFMIAFMVTTVFALYMLPLMLASLLVCVRSFFGTSPAVYVANQRLVYISAAYFSVKLNEIQTVEVERTGKSPWGNIIVKLARGSVRRISMAALKADESSLMRDINREKNASFDLRS